MATKTSKPEILVTGAAGALATRVIEQLRHDYRIVAVDFRRRAELGPDIPSYCVDYNKRGFADVFRQHNLRGVLHLGRMLVIDGSINNRYTANVLGTRRLLDLCRKHRVAPVLILSSLFVYGATPYNPAPLDEDAPLKASELTQELVDSVELENLANIYLWKYPELKITILRPCHIVGPGSRNTMGQLLGKGLAPVLAGFSPLMQFIHLDDAASAIVRAFQKNRPGVYNVAPNDWVPYQEAVVQAGCVGIPIPSVPSTVPWLISRLVGWRSFPAYFINYLKYPVILDGSRFKKTFGFVPTKSMKEIFEEYRTTKQTTSH